jgi:hypothetical protein
MGEQRRQDGGACEEPQVSRQARRPRSGQSRVRLLLVAKAQSFCHEGELQVNKTLQAKNYSLMFKGRLMRRRSPHFCRRCGKHAVRNRIQRGAKHRIDHAAIAGWNRLPWPDAPEVEDTTCRWAVNAGSRPGRRVEQKLTPVNESIGTDRALALAAPELSSGNNPRT